VIKFKYTSVLLITLGSWGNTL